MPGYNLRSGRDDSSASERLAARKAVKAAAAVKRSRSTDAPSPRSVEEYVARVAEVDAGDGTAAQKRNKKKDLQAQFQAMLLRQVEEGYESTDDEQGVEAQTDNLLAVRDYVLDVMRRENPSLDVSPAGICMRAAGLTVLPSPLDFTNLAVSLQPMLWPIVIDLHVHADDLREDFSAKTSGGKLQRAFIRQVELALTKEDNEPSKEEKDAIRSLSEILCQVASHWLAGHEDSATSFLARWAPLLESAKRLVREKITTAMVTRLLGVEDASEVKARTYLDPSALPPFIGNVVEATLKRPRFVTREGKLANVDRSDSTQRQRNKKFVEYDEGKHELITINGQEIVTCKNTKARLGRRKK
jgi:hypothetical protein